MAKVEHLEEQIGASVKGESFNSTENENNIFGNGLIGNQLAMNDQRLGASVKGLMTPSNLSTMQPKILPPIK